MALPRGIRNNNPLNIVKGNNWKGERQVQSDSRFEEFTSMEFGIRAAIRLVQNYINGRNSSGRKLNTLELVVRRWAPPSENATETYIKAVENLSGLSRHLHLYADDRNNILLMLQAMAVVETGIEIPMAVFRSAWELL